MSEKKQGNIFVRAIVVFLGAYVFVELILFARLFFLVIVGWEKYLPDEMVNIVWQNQFRFFFKNLLTIKSIGIFLSVIGIWLSGAGILGEERLKKIEGQIRNQIKSLQSPLNKTVQFTQTIDSKVSNYGQSNPDRTNKASNRAAPFLAVSFTMMVFFGIFSAFFPESRFISWVTSASYVILMLSLFSVVFVSFSPMIFGYLGLFSIPFFAILLILAKEASVPYQLLDKFVEKHKLQSTVTLIGMILSSIGVFLTT